MQAGGAENMARRIAKIVAKRLGEHTVTCIWMKPETVALTEEFRREVPVV